MKISFNPSNSNKNILDLIKNNKDIIFDLKGHSIFARGVEFKGTDTNTWRDIKINNVSIGSHTLDLRNGSNTTLTNTNGVVTINSTWRPVVDNLTSDSTTSSLSAKQGKVLKALIDGKSNSDHNHDGRYLKLTGGTMAGNALITFADSGSYGTNKKPQGARGGLYWTGQSDYAKLYAEETVRDNLDLVIQFGDDDSNGLSIRNKANTQTSYISSSGVITTGTFKGNLDWSYITNKPATATRWPSWAEVTGKPSSFTPSTHTHGLSNSVFFLNMPSINGNAKWKEVFGYPVNYNLLLSVRINNPAPEWCVGNFGSGILYGGSDTKGFMSSAYNEPFIMWAGGNRSSDDPVPKWYIGIKGTHKSIYNLATIASEANAAYNLRHSHANKSVLDGITSTLVNSWNTAYNFVSNITGTDTDKVINKWEEIVNFLAGITEDNKLNTLLNSKLSGKLDRVNLTTGGWNPRGWNLAADYHYNGGDLSISENNGKMYVSVNGCFWQNKGQYRVLDTSDIGDIQNSVTLHQYLSATDVAWYPLVWGGNAHYNTSDSTGAVYKSYDKLSWQTSSQTLYATNIKTDNIKSLSIGGGIYWNPYVESASDGSDVASITLVRSGVAGGTTLVLSQMNDTNDTIQFKTNTAARLYHNSYPILTTQNTYVSNNKGYINGLEITQVNNAATATKLQTPRNIWGQSFDGTADVRGTLSEVANIQFSADGAYDIGSNSAASRCIYTHWLGAKSGQKLELGANNSGYGKGLCIDTNLNVGIGTNTPTQKLDVHGNIRATGQIIREGSGQLWVSGRNGALLRETSAVGYHTLWSLKTTNGSWDFGEYNTSGWYNIPVLSYTTDSNYNSGNNATTYQIKFPLASGTVALTSDISNYVAIGRISSTLTDYEIWCNTNITCDISRQEDIYFLEITFNNITVYSNEIDNYMLFIEKDFPKDNLLYYNLGTSQNKLKLKYTYISSDINITFIVYKCKEGSIKYTVPHPS